jgi:hypothetical protein
MNRPNPAWRPVLIASILLLGAIDLVADEATQRVQEATAPAGASPAALFAPPAPPKGDAGISGAECAFDNLFPIVGSSPASQKNPGVLGDPFFAEAADDFVLPGDPANPCDLQEVHLRMAFFNIPAGVIPTPADCWTAVKVTIYEDVAGADLPPPCPSGKGPAGYPNEMALPQRDHVECVPGGIRCELKVSMDQVVTMPTGTANEFDVWIGGLGGQCLLEKNHKYWIAVAPEMEFGACGQVAIRRAPAAFGHTAQRIFPLLGVPWMPLPAGGDLAISVLAEKAGPSQPGYCPADVNGDKEVNVQDLVAVVLDWACAGDCVGDVNQDGATDVQDLVLVVLAWGACPAPANDECAAKIDILRTDPAGVLTVAFDARGATPSPEPLLCGPDIDNPFKDVWYCLHYDPPVEQKKAVTLSTSIPLDIEVSAGCVCPPLALLACGPGLAGVTFIMQAGEEVCIRLLNTQGLDNEDLKGLLTIVNEPVVVAPPNDACSDRLPVADGVHPFDTTSATTDPADPPFRCGAGVGKDIWFNYLAPANGTLLLSTFGSGFDTVLKAYDSFACPPDDADNLGCNDDAGGTLQSQLTLDVANGQQIKIRVGGWQGASGAGVLNVTHTEVIGPRQCPPGTNYGQRPHQVEEDNDGDGDSDWVFGTSDKRPGYIRYEDFPHDGREITGLCFWGADLHFDVDQGAFVECDLSNPFFNVAFYLDNGAGLPLKDAPACTYLVKAVEKVRKDRYAGFVNAWFYSVVFDPPCILPPGKSWVSIQGAGGGPADSPECWFLWLSSPESNLPGSVFHDLNTGVQEIAPFDLSLCIKGATSRCGQCGPGPHWVDGCGAGTDTVIDNSALVTIDTNFDCLPDVTLSLSGCGAMVVNKFGPADDSGFFPGLRPVDGHLDVIDTEMKALCLAGGGATLSAGAGMGQGGILGPTLGAIAEHPGDPALADSFFDVFFEVDLGGGNLLYNQTPLRVEADITCVPPRATYRHPPGCFPLYTSPIPGQGVHVANLINANHFVFEEPNPFGCPGPGACCAPQNTPACNNIECCRLVCAVDPFCCDVLWDPNCVSQAGQFAACGCGAALVIPPGIDCWVTTCGGGTQYGFSTTPIPADFFGPGSQPFTGTVQLGGIPSGPFGSDTAVRRIEPASLFGPGTEVTIPIELVQLSLVSCNPITVTFSGGPPQQWDVNVTINPPSPMGTMTITQTHATGGSFTSTLPVHPIFTFTRVNPPGQIIGPVDFGITIVLEAQGPFLAGQPLPFPLCGPGFAPGYQNPKEPCCVEVCHCTIPPSDKLHCVMPPQCPHCPPPPPNCPGPGGCCVAHPSPGCNIPDCCARVCAVDPFCCDIQWDPQCVNHAFQFPQCGCN